MRERLGARFRPGGGYSLLGLLIVVTLLGLLMGIGIPLYSAYIEQARITRAIDDIGSLQKEIQMYKLTRKALPPRLSEVGEVNLLDPYGRPYQYLNFSDARQREKRRKDRFHVPINTEYDLYSLGKDGESLPPLTARQSHDDIVRANDGLYIGLASEF